MSRKLPPPHASTTMPMIPPALAHLAFAMVSLHLVPAPNAAAGGEFSSPRCPITATAVPIRLTDGAAVTVDPSTVAANGPELLVLGTPTTLWQLDAQRRWIPRSQSEAIGVVVDASGRSEIVPPPIALGPSLLHARARRAGAGAWDVLFISGAKGVPRHLHAYDTATVWLAQYVGRKWRNVRPIARARSALLMPDMSSSLVRRGRELLFAYPYDLSLADTISQTSSRGVVLLRGGGAAWREDTLPLRIGARAVQLVEAGDTSAIVVLATAPLEGGRALTFALFATTHTTSGWRPPTLVASDSMHANLIDAVASAHGALVSWRVEDPQGKTDDFRIGVLSPQLRLEHQRSLGTGDMFSRPAIAARPDGVAIAVAAGTARNTLDASFPGDDGVTPPTQVAAPVSLARLRATILDDMRVALWTNSEGADASEPPFASHLVLLQLRCDSTRERNTPPSSRERREPHAPHATPRSRPRGAAPDPHRLRGSS